MSCHTLQKEHVQEDKTAQFKCVRGAVMHSTDIIRSDLGGSNLNNSDTCSTLLPINGPRRGLGQEKCESAGNDTAIRDTGNYVADGRGKCNV